MNPRIWQRPCTRYLFVITALLAAPAALADPPKVIKATPDNGEENVDPATREIRIVFDQPMTTGENYSVVGGGESYPRMRGKPRWVNDRTIVLSVELEPDHEYWLSINNENFKAFRSRKGESAEPYPISFKTAGAGKTPPKVLTPEINRKSIEVLKEAIDQSYSYRDLRKLDWDALFKEAAPRLEAAKNPRQFATEAGKLLAKNEDVHVWLKVGTTTIPSFRRKVAPNYSLRLLEKLVPSFSQKSDIVYTGRYPDGIGYVLIASWSAKDAEPFKGAFAALKQDALKGLIIDVRPNSGGAEPLAQQFAGCFVEKPKVYAKHVIREAGRFGDVRERSIAPSEDRPSYRGKVAVLTGPAVMSSCESFLLMMKQVPGCRLFGQASYGSSGNPQPVELPSGVTVYLPCWKDLRPDGTCFEGEGIAPDVEIKTQPKDFESADPVLEAALKWLRGGTAGTRPAR